MWFFIYNVFYAINIFSLVIRNNFQDIRQKQTIEYGTKLLYNQKVFLNLPLNSL